MAAYIIFVRDRIRDPAGFADYGAVAGGTLAGHPAKPLVVYHPMETLEGPSAEAMVMIEFPTMADARAWYDSPAYVEARQLRFASADFRVFITDGLPAA